jgi:chorismate mutase
MSEPVSSPAEARRVIDEIDEDLIRMLARRERLARTLGVGPPEATIERVRNLALVHGLDPRVAEETWRSLLAGLERLELREQAGS